MDMPSLPDQEMPVAMNSELETLKVQVAALTAEIAELRSKLPPEPPPLMLSDFKVYGHVRPELPKPDESWLPSWQECADLAKIVEKRYPELVTRSDGWVIMFRRAMLALGHIGRLPAPGTKYSESDFRNRCYDWLTDHHMPNDLDRDAFLAAVAAAGDIPFSCLKSNFRGDVPSLGLAQAGTGTAADKKAWRKVLATGKLIGEVGTASPPPGQSRWDNPRSSVTLVPELDRTKGY